MALVLEYRAAIVKFTGGKRFSLGVVLTSLVVCPAERVQNERKKRLINEDSGLQLFVVNDYS